MHAYSTTMCTSNNNQKHNNAEEQIYTYILRYDKINMYVSSFTTHCILRIEYHIIHVVIYYLRYTTEICVHAYLTIDY